MQNTAKAITMITVRQVVWTVAKVLISQSPDYHFGYILFAAAVALKLWPTTPRPGLATLIRDIAARPQPVDLHFPVARHFDFFVGHSWASGLSVFADAKNQESTSEAVNAYYAVALIGMASGDKGLEQWGRVLAKMETRSARQYWQIVPNNHQQAEYGTKFDKNGCVGVLWSTKVDYATWFGRTEKV